MNQTEMRPLSDRARTRIVAAILAEHATWQLASVGPIYPRPFDGYLYADGPVLLVHATILPLAAAIAEMSDAMRLARSDGLVVACRRFASGWSNLEIALALATPGESAWHRPLQPWLAEGGDMWLVPHRDADERLLPSIRLVARRLRPYRHPWRDAAERIAGFTRADRALALAATREGRF